MRSIQVDNNYRLKPVVVAMAAAGMSMALAGPALAAGVATGEVNDGLIAPFTNSFQPGRGVAARFAVRLDESSAGELRVVGLLFNEGGSPIGTSAGSAASGDPVVSTLTVPTLGTVTDVVFVVEILNPTDTIEGVNGDDTFGVLIPGDDRMSYEIVPIPASDWKGDENFSAADNSQLLGIAAQAAAVPGALQSVTDYSGPTLTAAQTANQVNAENVRLSFDAHLAEIGADTDVSSQVALQDGATTQGTATTFGDVAAGDKFVRVDDGNATPDFPVTNVDIALDTDTPNITDEAGNPAQPVVDFEVTPFPAPDFAPEGTAKALLSEQDLNTFDPPQSDNEVVRGLFGDDGLPLGKFTDGFFDVTLRLNDILGGNGVEPGDVEVLPSSLVVSSVEDGSGTDRAVIRLRNNTSVNVILRATADGQLLADGAPVTVRLVVEDGDPLQSEEGVEITGQSAAEPVYIALQPTPELGTGDLKTASGDDLPDGVLDSARIDAIAPFQTPLPSPLGCVIVDVDDTTEQVTANAVQDPLVPTRINLIANSQSSIVDLLEDDESEDDNLNTGATSSSADPIPYAVECTDSDLTYEGIYRVSNGELSTLSNVAFDAPLADQALPVVKSITFLREEGKSTGDLQFVASEPLDDLNEMDADGNNYSFDGSPLNLLNLNDAGALVGGGDLTSNGIRDSIFTFTGVTDSVVGRTLTRISRNTDYVDETDDENPLTTGGDIVVVEGDTTFAEPKMVAAATAFRANDTSEGNVVDVIVQYDRGVKLNPAGDIVDGTFKLIAVINGAEIVIDVPADNVNLDDAENGVIRIELPDPGLIADDRLEELWVEYDGDGNNTLQSTEGDMPPAFEDGAFDFGGSDGDTQRVQLPKNTGEEITQDLRGAILLDGEPVEGAVVKATVVRVKRFSAPITINRAAVNIPCDCGADGTQLIRLEVADADELRDQITDILNGESSRPFAEGVIRKTEDLNGQGVSAMLYLGDNVPAPQHPSPGSTTSSTNRGTTTDYLVRVLAPAPGSTGMLIEGHVTGSIRFDQALDTSKADGGGPSLSTVGFAFANTMADGGFRLIVGVDGNTTEDGTALSLGDGELFVIVAVKKPGGNFVQVTSGWPGFANYVPFSPDLGRNSGVVRDLGEVDLRAIEEIVLQETKDWQGIGVTREPRSSALDPVVLNAPDGTDQPFVERAFVSIDKSTGMPETHWISNTRSADAPSGEDRVFGDVSHGDGGDELIRLTNNMLTSAIQVNNDTVIRNIARIRGGQGLFFRDDRGTGGSVFIPVQGSPVSLASLDLQPGTWTSVIVPEATTASELAADLGLAGIIRVGSGRQAASWFDGESKNSLREIQARDVLFILKEAPPIN